ncbi:unnamed protein product [Clavelina lepadiformis]|uniref:Uncharacterized protein n=1 Tax=Clavelina lepadiformis TaxID=159417 RepID=A0ABP0GLP3_CLALP
MGCSPEAKLTTSYETPSFPSAQQRHHEVATPTPQYLFRRTVGDFFPLMKQGASHLSLTASPITYYVLKLPSLAYKFVIRYHFYDLTVLQMPPE